MYCHNTLVNAKKIAKPQTDQTVRVHSHRALPLILALILVLTLERNVLISIAQFIQSVNTSFKIQMGYGPIQKLQD